jgi:hypothetical protein
MHTVSEKKSKRSFCSLIKQTYFLLGQKHFSCRFSTLYYLSYLTSCGVQVCKPYILCNLCVTCSLLLAVTNVVHGYSLTIPLKCDPCFHYAYMMRVGREEEIGFRRLPLSFAPTGLIKVTGWMYRTFEIPIGRGSNNNRKGIFHWVICDYTNIRYRSVVAKLLNHTIHVTPVHKAKGSVTYPLISRSISWRMDPLLDKHLETNEYSRCYATDE